MVQIGTISLTASNIRLDQNPDDSRFK